MLSNHNPNVSLLPDNPSAQIMPVQGGGGSGLWHSSPITVENGTYQLALNHGFLKKFKTRWRQTLGPNIPSRRKPRQDPHIIVGSLNAHENPVYLVAPLRGDSDAATRVFSWSDNLLTSEPNSHIVFMGPIVSAKENSSIESAMSALLSKYPGHIIFVSDKETTLPSLDGLLLEAVPHTSKQIALGFIPHHENVYNRSSRSLNKLIVETLRVPYSKKDKEETLGSLHYLKFQAPTTIKGRDRDNDEHDITKDMSFKVIPGWVTQITHGVKMSGGAPLVKAPLVKTPLVKTPLVKEPLVKEPVVDKSTSKKAEEVKKAEEIKEKAKEAEEVKDIKSEVKADVTPEVKPDTKTEVTPVVTPDVTPDVKTEVTPEVKSEDEVKPDTKTEVKPDAKTEVTPEVKSEDEVKPDTKTEVKPDTKTEVTPEVKSEDEVKPDTKTEVTPVVTPDVTPDVKPEVKPLVTPDVKPDVKPLVTPDVTPELKPLVTPDVKTDVKPEVTPDVKTEVTPEMTPEVTPEVKPQAPAFTGATVTVTLDSDVYDIRNPSDPSVINDWSNGKFEGDEIRLLDNEGLRYNNDIYSKFLQGLVNEQCSTEPDVQMRPECGIFRYIMANRYFNQVRFKNGRKPFSRGNTSYSSDSVVTPPVTSQASVTPTVTSKPVEPTKHVGFSNKSTVRTENESGVHNSKVNTAKENGDTRGKVKKARGGTRSKRNPGIKLKFLY